MCRSRAGNAAARPRAPTASRATAQPSDARARRDGPPARRSPRSRRRARPARPARRARPALSQSRCACVQLRVRQSALVAQKQLADPVAGAHQIAAQVLARAHQVAQRLLFGRRHPHRVQLTRHQQPHQQLGVAAIGLHPILGRTRDLARRGDQTLDTGRPEPPRQPKAGRPRLERHPHRPRQARRRTPTTSPVLPSQPLRAQLARPRVNDRGDHLRRVHIETDKRPSLTHGRHPHDCGQRRGPFLDAINPRSSCAGADRHITTGRTRRRPIRSSASNLHWWMKFAAVYPTPFWRAKGLTGQVVSENGVKVTFDTSPESGTPG